MFDADLLAAEVGDRTHLHHHQLTPRSGGRCRACRR